MRISPLDMSAQDRRRLEHLSGLFDKNGASLALQRASDGGWRASVADSASATVRLIEVRGWTAVEAAEVAWLRFRDQLAETEGEAKDAAAPLE